MQTDFITEAIFTLDEVKNGMKHSNIVPETHLNVLCLNEDHELAMHHSLKLIMSGIADIYVLVYEVVQNIYVLEYNGSNSFADQLDSGSIYLYPKERPTIGYFVEEILHQSGHLILQAVCSRGIYLLNSNWTVGSLVHHKRAEGRSCLVVLHSVYTLYCICMGLNSILKKNEVSHSTYHEFMGRILFASGRLKSDVSLLIETSSLTQKGLSFIRKICYRVNLILVNNRHELSRLDLQGQSYDFSSREFHKRNQ